MKKYFKEWEGNKFPIREVRLPEELGGHEVTAADIELFNAFEKAFYLDSHPKHKEALDLNREICYYCESGFVANDPTDEEIIQHLEWIGI